MALHGLEPSQNGVLSVDDILRNTSADDIRLDKGAKYLIDANLRVNLRGILYELIFCVYLRYSILLYSQLADLAINCIWSRRAMDCVLKR